MGKCLVTRLQEVVNNSNLKKLGEMIVETTGDNSDSEYQIGFVASDVVTLFCADGIYDINDVLQGTTVNVPANSEAYYRIKKNKKLSIIPKYGIKRWQPLVGIKVNLDDFTYMDLSDGIKSYSKVVNGMLENVLEKHGVGTIPLLWMAGGVGVLPIGDTIDPTALSVFNGISETKIIFRIESTNGDKLSGGDLYDIISNIHGFTPDMLYECDIFPDVSNPNKFSCNVEKFANCTNLLRFCPNYTTNITGSLITACSNMTNLNTIAIPGYAGGEELAPLFDTLHSKGRTSGTINLWAGNATINGGTASNVRVTFNANGWTVGPRS